MDTAVQERLVSARARLRSAIEESSFPSWFVETAQRCLVDLDCALVGGMSETKSRMLLAQIDALITAAGESGRGRIRRDGDPR